MTRRIGAKCGRRSWPAPRGKPANESSRTGRSILAHRTSRPWPGTPPTATPRTWSGCERSGRMGELNAGDRVRIIDDAFDDWTGWVGRIVLVLSRYVVCMDGTGKLLG